MNSRTVVVAGATGLVGKEILAGLLADPSVAAAQPWAADEVYRALGTTIKVAGSQAAFRSVDYDANLSVAKAALAEMPFAGLVIARPSMLVGNREALGQPVRRWRGRCCPRFRPQAVRRRCSPDQ